MAMSLKSPDNQSGWQYSSKPKNDGGMNRRDDHQTMGEERKSEEQEKRILVLALPAVNNNKKQMKKEKKEKERGETAEREKTEVESQTIGTEGWDGDGDEEEEEDDDDDGGSWPHLFAEQLIKMNEGRIPKEEDIPMIPNSFFKDLSQL